VHTLSIVDSPTVKANDVVTGRIFIEGSSMAEPEVEAAWRAELERVGEDRDRVSETKRQLVFRAPELAAKQLDLLVEAFPDDKPIAVLWKSASADQFNAAQRVAQSMHVELRSHKLEKVPIDFDQAFTAIVHDGSRSVLVLSGPSFTAQRSHIADLAIQHRLPTMFTFKLYVEAGGLMSYGIDVVPIFRRAASYVAKILRGAKPSDLPVEEPTNFEFALNLKTAKAIGVTVPTSILLRADEVIE